MENTNYEKWAEKAYNAYGRTTNYKNHLGKQMPQYEHLPLKIQQAWVAAVKCIHELSKSP